MSISIIYGIKNMENISANPLAKHFRQPAIYMKLPSGGRFWKEGSLNLPATGDIPVYPMTARDEITIRTPDALMNGQGVVDVIQSCCPNIIDAWKMPSIDVDAVLLNIRIASYGGNMDFDTKCPACQNESSFSLDMGKVVQQISMPNYDDPLVFDGFKIKLKPQPYFEVNRVNQISFTEQQILRSVNDNNIPDEEKKAITEKYLNKLIDLNIEVSLNSTSSITLDDGTVVTNIMHIKEFYANAEYRILKDIEKRLKEINDQVALDPVDVVCSACANEYKIPLTFDYANFFG